MYVKRISKQPFYLFTTLKSFLKKKNLFIHDPSCPTLQSTSGLYPQMALIYPILTAYKQIISPTILHIILSL